MPRRASLSIRPPPLAGIYEVPDSGSLIAWEPRLSLRQEVSHSLFLKQDWSAAVEMVIVSEHELNCRRCAKPRKTQPWIVAKAPAAGRNVILGFLLPGKPIDNAYIEAFNDRFRTESLNVHWLMGLEDTAGKSEAWRKNYNEERPHKRYREYGSGSSDETTRRIQPICVIESAENPNLTRDILGSRSRPLEKQKKHLYR